MGRKGACCLSPPWLWLWLWTLLAAQRATAASVFWTADVTIQYPSPTDNKTVSRSCECGVYGYNSPLSDTKGRVALPVQDPLACEPDTSFTNNPDEQWVALIERGNCTFTQKVLKAAQQGASAVLIYNLAGTGNETSPMYLEGTGNTVAIMIGHGWGAEIVSLIQNGFQVNICIAVGHPHGPWLSQYSLILVSLSFFVVTAVTVGYFIFHSARRLHSARALKRKQKKLKAEAKKAIGQLQVRTLQQGDQETGPEADTCAVCIEAYRPGDVVSMLTCSHFFHKPCIEPWLLDHRTCPMCKCDILKSLGIELETEESMNHGNEVQVAVLPDLRTHTTTLSIIEDDTRSETASSGYASVHDSEDTAASVPHQNQQNPNGEAVQVEVQPHYDNLAFEGDSKSSLEARS